MKKKIILIGLIFVLISLGFSGCTQQNSSVNQGTEKTIPPTIESVQALLTKAETIESMYYEITASITMSQFGTQTASIKIWQKRPYLKAVITGATAGTSNTISVIQRPEGIYTYDTSQEKYILTTEMTSFASSLQYLDSGIIKQYLRNQSVTNFETETIDGKQTTIIQYALPQGDNQMTIKIWIWNEKGVPLKAFFTMNLEDYTMTMDFIFSNYSFTEIPDSTFSVS